MLLGINVGTTGTTAAVFDAAGALLARAYLEYQFTVPKFGWAEMDPEKW